MELLGSYTRETFSFLTDRVLSPPFPNLSLPRTHVVFFSEMGRPSRKVPPMKKNVI